MNQNMIISMLMIMWYDLCPGKCRPRALRTGFHITSILTHLEEIEEDVWDRNTNVE
jgi:hypothetical protein